MGLMREHLGVGEPAEAVARLVALAEDRPLAVLCLESDQRRCHRQVVLDAALDTGPDARCRSRCTDGELHAAITVLWQ